MYDPGAVVRADGVTYAEADIALQYALTLNFLLKERGISTFMTRTSSAELAPLEGRTRRSLEAGCTHVVSLHLNAIGSTAHGVEVAYRRTKDKAMAPVLSSRIARAAGLTDRGTKRRTDLAVLKFNDRPALLIELGFLTNMKDRQALTSGRGIRVQICQAILETLERGGRA